MRKFYKDQIFDKTDDALLDRHKVASCICVAFLQVSVFNKERMVNRIIDTGEKVHSYFFYANELVALYAANRFLSFFMLEVYYIEKNTCTQLLCELKIYIKDISVEIGGKEGFPCMGNPFVI